MDPDAEMAKYLAERDEWQAGRNPPKVAGLLQPSAVALADLVTALLHRTGKAIPP